MEHAAAAPSSPHPHTHTRGMDTKAEEKERPAPLFTYHSSPDGSFVNLRSSRATPALGTMLYATFASRVL
eukprot:scaffold214926_cov30-Tisochrysis_lutea.AAC.4